MKCSIEQSKEKYIPEVAPLSDGKVTFRRLGYRENDQSGQAESDACKEDFATGHVVGDAKLLKSEFDQRISPAPNDGCRKCENRNPQRALEYTCISVHGTKIKLFSITMSFIHLIGYFR